MQNTDGVTNIQNIHPCDVCRYNPPSSNDGKPCAMCPAERMLKDNEEENV